MSQIEMSNPQSIKKNLLYRTVSLFSSVLYQTLTMNILVDAGQESEGFIDQTIVKKYYHYYFNILNILYSAFSFFSGIDEWTKNTAGKWRKGMKTQSY